MKIKIIINTICFFLLTIIIAVILSIIVTKADYPQKNIIKNFYDEPKNELDVVFIGGSSTFTSWIPLRAWKDYGITSLEFATPGMPVASINYVIKEVLKYQKPKLIIFNTDIIIDDEIAKPSKRNDAFKLITTMKMSLDKLLMVNAIYNSFGLNFYNGLEYYFPVIRFHSRWKILKDIIKDSNNMNKQKKGMFDLKKFYEDKNGINIINTNVVGEWDYFASHLRYIYDIYLYLSNLDTQVLLVNTPLQKEKTDEINFDIRYDYIYKLADDYNLPHINFASPDMIKKLNITKYDYIDEEHFNYQGAVKYTDYLAKILINQYHIPDRRNDSKYDSWNKAYDEYKSFLKEKYNLILN